MVAENFKGIYEKMDFPAYKFREYPKWLYPKDKTPFVVQTQQEEIHAIATDPSVVTPVNALSTPENAKMAMELNALRDVAAKQAKELEELKALLIAQAQVVAVPKAPEVTKPSPVEPAQVPKPPSVASKTP